MGTKAQFIVGEGVKETIDMLNRALADEWLAYYQYWVGSFVVRGPMRPDVQKELKEHAEEELKHAGMLADRIIQLGGTPLLSPYEWQKKSGCGYTEPKDPGVLPLLAQNIKGEQCAIMTYSTISKKVMGKDIITFHMARKILADEIRHEQDLQDLEQDIKMI